MVAEEMKDKDKLKKLNLGKGPVRLKMEVPSSLKSIDFWQRSSLFQFIYSLAGLVLGLVCVIGGIILFLHGVTGSTSWTAKFIGLESNISDAAPGAILFIVGLFVVWITRFDIKVRK
jgi:hypothetical protein